MSELAVSVRSIAKGTTNFVNGANQIGPFTRKPGERVEVLVFIADDVVLDWANQRNSGGVPDIAFSCERTTNPHEFNVNVTNSSGATRSVDWEVYGRLSL